MLLTHNEEDGGSSPPFATAQAEDSSFACLFGTFTLTSDTSSLATREGEMGSGRVSRVLRSRTELQGRSCGCSAAGG